MLVPWASQVPVPRDRVCGNAALHRRSREGLLKPTGHAQVCGTRQDTQRGMADVPESAQMPQWKRGAPDGWKKANVNQPARWARTRILKTAGQSALPPSLGKLWSKRSQKHFSAHSTQGGDWEQPAQTHQQQITLHQPGWLLQTDEWLCR